MYESEIFEKDSAEKKLLTTKHEYVCKGETAKSKQYFLFARLPCFYGYEKKRFITFEKLIVLDVVIKVFCEKI